MAAIVALYAILYASSSARVHGSNAWDAVFPSLTETKVTSQVGLLWFCSFIIPICFAFGRPEVMQRYGSWARAVRKGLAELVGRLVAGGAVITLVVIVVAFPLGVGTTWSSEAVNEAASDAQLSAFSAAALARHFSNPVIALAACGLYTGAAYMIVAAFTLAVAARRVTAAVWGLMFFYVWALICSFAMTDLPNPADASVALSIAWALSQGGLLQAATGLAVCIIITLVLTRVKHPISGARAMIQNRVAVTIALLALTVAGSVQVAAHTGTLTEFTAAYFAGSYGDIVQFIAAAVIPLAFATRYAAELTDRAEGLLLYEAVRAGSYRRWTIRSLARELVQALIFVAAYGAVLTATYAVVHGGTGLGKGGHIGLLLVDLTGIAAELILLLTAAMLLFWLRGSLDAWPALVGVAVVLGYPFMLNLGAANIFAPYSTPPESVGPGPQTVALLWCIVAAALCLVTTMFRTHSRHVIRVADVI
ncbi:hypothetical protein IV498_14755 [Paenarthrobacter sp. Z7-10]|uniref:hypothetical protein n=1 Tax=Paenarthrobacter sp. Z7-10 TaxID=2787635 RepID=UPI0022A9C4FC|nr:hypothetical protein [Paenarthrobacter sp. Z7-10]MCZ2404402.1 hypothetical protein [Paenarthrobacter sp. Z7-10]